MKPGIPVVETDRFLYNPPKYLNSCLKYVPYWA